MISDCDKMCTEIHTHTHTHYMFTDVFPKLVPFMRSCEKSWWSQRGHKGRRNMTDKHCMLDKQGYTCINTPTFPDTHTYARTHTHTGKYVTLVAFPRKQEFAYMPQCCVMRIMPILFKFTD
jgi:hypothetical protein